VPDRCRWTPFAAARQLPKRYDIISGGGFEAGDMFARVDHGGALRAVVTGFTGIGNATCAIIRFGATGPTLPV